jgi:hypothetical protein
VQAETPGMALLVLRQLKILIAANKMSAYFMVTFLIADNHFLYIVA